MHFSCIIPAYNEGPRIAEVLATALACDALHEVIVVNDGSTDNTREVIESFHHTKLRKIHQKNTGKAGAILRGVEESSSEYIVMIDSDLIGLTTDHIERLIAPIKNREADMTLSIRENSLPVYKWIGSDFVSGERVVPRDVFADCGYYTGGGGFGLEVKMNEKILEAGLCVKNIFLPGVITPRKAYKMGYLKGTISDLKMTRDIIRSMPIWKLVRQMYRFSRFCSDADVDSHRTPF